jgi:2-polyprenyl-3-methyl-5-hydroxy-6-metoxy-1,4-benzoquinol methylase
MTILAAEYVLGIVPVGTHEWNKYIKPEEMKLMLESVAVNMTVDKTVGLKLSLDLVSKSMVWKVSKYDTNVNYILHASKK